MLVSRAHKKLVLHLREPERVTAVIPSARAFEYRGRPLVAVPHRDDEVRVLRNLGMDPPTPIETYYDWPGRKPPFAHQKATAGFLTTHPRAFCLSGMGCIEGDAMVRVSRKGKSQQMSLRELHRKFHAIPDPDTWKARSLKGDVFGMHKLLDVLYQGEKPTLRITLACGKQFRATADHRVARPDGAWTEAGHLQVGDELVTNGSRSSKGGVVVVTPAASPVVRIEDGGVVDVYDLCMEAPHHNFVVNGVVVHNSGKTLATLWAYDWLRKQGRVHRMLVIAPLSTLERAWGDEIFANFPDMTFTVLHGSRERRHKLLDEDFDVYIINHDGFTSPQTLERLRRREGLDLVVVDELATFRNSSTTRWKALNHLINGYARSRDPAQQQPIEWAWGLTGTPTPNEPTDAWAQVRVINPTRVPPYRGHFRDQVMRQITPFKWTAREGALDVVHRAMQPAIRFAREDCIDLPPTTYVTRQVELTREQKAAFVQMLRQLRAEFDGGEITAANEAVKMGKLTQILAGVAYGPDGQHIHIPATPRIQLVQEIIEEAEAKVIVFVPLTAPLLHLADELGKHYSVAVVHGGTTKAERDEIFAQFQQSPNPRVLLANPGTLSHGLTLTAANTVVWFTPIHSNETYQQACARVTRPGQRHNTLIVNIEATPLERRIYERLQGREKMQGILLDLVRNNP